MKNTAFSLNRLLAYLALPLLLAAGVFSCLQTGNFMVVAGTYNTEKGAIDKAKELNKEGINSEVYQTGDGKYLVTVGSYLTDIDAEEEKDNQVKTKLIPKDSYVLERKETWKKVYPESLVDVTGKPDKKSDNETTTDATKADDRGKSSEKKKSIDDDLEDEFVVYPD